MKIQKPRVQKLALILLVLVLAACTACKGEEEDGTGITAEQVSGDVTLHHESGSYTLKSGIPLYTGDEILTGRVASCTVAASGGMNAVLDTGTRVKLGVSADSLALEVMSGCVYMKGFLGTERIDTADGYLLPDADAVISIEAYTGTQTANLYQGTAKLVYNGEEYILQAGDRATMIRKEDELNLVRSIGTPEDLEQFLLEQLIADGGMGYPGEQLESILEERLAEVRSTVESSAQMEEELQEDQQTCYMEIRCDTILSGQKLKGDEPKDGIILAGKEIPFEKGDTAFDLLRRYCKEEDIKLKYVFMPTIGGYYIKGIAGIEELEYGQLSGWLYKVNGWYPNYGASGYQIQEGDVIVWLYTCDGGTDVGQNKWIEKE